MSSSSSVRNRGATDSGTINFPTPDSSLYLPPSLIQVQQQNALVKSRRKVSKESLPTPKKVEGEEEEDGRCIKRFLIREEKGEEEEERNKSTAQRKGRETILKTIFWPFFFLPLSLALILGGSFPAFWRHLPDYPRRPGPPRRPARRSFLFD